MSEGPLRCWEDVKAFALTFPGTELGTSYHMPTVRVSANGRGFVWTSHEAETSFAIWAEPGAAEMLIETDPDTFWQSPHYAGSNAALVRYASNDPDRVRHRIECSRDLVAAMKPVRKR